MDVDQGPSSNSNQPTHPLSSEFEWTASESVCAAVVQAAASVSNDPMTELPPLYEAVDPDALETLVSDRSGSPTEERVEISFTFHDCLVTVSSSGDGRIDYRPVN